MGVCALADMANMANSATPQAFNGKEFIPHSSKLKLYQHA
jgi:hypothetical protein